MERKPFELEFNKLFKRYGNESRLSMMKPDTDLYKRFWNFLMIGDSYYFLLNHHSLEIEFVSIEFEDVLGYLPSEFTVPFINSIIHPDDRSWFLTIGSSILDFFSVLSIDKLTKYKVRYDYRLKKKNGEYIRILYQGILVEHDEKGRFTKTLNFHSDITYLKQEGKPVLSFIGIDGEPSYIDVASNNLYNEENESLTTREKQVLKLLIEGKSSKEISSILRISKQTVDTHRKNMLRKKNILNTNELIAKAIRYGWI